MHFSACIFLLNVDNVQLQTSETTKLYKDKVWVNTNESGVDLEVFVTSFQSYTTPSPQPMTCWTWCINVGIPIAAMNMDLCYKMYHLSEYIFDKK